MNTVEPIRIKEQIELIKQLEPDKRNRLLFILGINVGLRMQRPGGIESERPIRKDRIVKREQKTGKENRHPAECCPPARYTRADGRTQRR